MAKERGLLVLVAGYAWNSALRMYEPTVFEQVIQSASVKHDTYTTTSGYCYRGEDVFSLTDVTSARVRALQRAVQANDERDAPWTS